jgi:signal transduction histidine kinase
VIAIYESRARAKSLELDIRVEPQLTIVGLQGELKQILSNLLANSIDACGKGNKIILACRGSINHATGTRGVRFTIADNGCGISVADREKVFNPFFTTKKVVGTGLGLWITKDLLEKRGGNIRLRSSIDPARPGTVFRCFLRGPSSAD